MSETVDDQNSGGAAGGSVLSARQLNEVLADRLLVEAGYEDTIAALRTEVAAMAAEAAAGLKDTIAAFEDRERSLMAEVALLRDAVEAPDSGGGVPSDEPSDEPGTRPAAWLEAERERDEALAGLQQAREQQAGELESRAAARKALLAVLDNRAYMVRSDTETRFGPASLLELEAWAADCRLGPDHEVSADGHVWIKATDLPGVGLDWTVDLVDGSQLGPVHLAAIAGLIQDGAVGHDAEIVNVRNGRRGTYTSLVEEDIQTRILDRERWMAALRDAIGAAWPSAPTTATAE